MVNDQDFPKLTGRGLDKGGGDWTTSNTVKAKVILNSLIMKKPKAIIAFRIGMLLILIKLNHLYSIIKSMNNFETNKLTIG